MSAPSRSVAPPRTAGPAPSTPAAPLPLDDPNPTQFVRIRSDAELARLLREAAPAPARNVREAPAPAAASPPPRRLPRPTVLGWVVLGLAFGGGLGLALLLVLLLAR